MTAWRLARCTQYLVALGLAGCGSDGAASGGSGAGGAADAAGTPGVAGDPGSAAGTSAGASPEGGKSSGGAGGAHAAGAPSAGASGSGTVIEGCAQPPGAAPEQKWVNATGNLAKMASECGNLGLVSAQPCSNRVIAGVAQKGLWETLDGGKTWAALGKGAGSAVITNRISAIVYDPKDPKIFWESGIYNGGGVYRTTDSGQTFSQLGDVTHCDSVSVDFSDPERKTLLAGGHETNTKLSLSKDGGKTWMNIAAGLPSGQCTATAVINAQTLLVGCNSGSITRSENGGANWATATGSSIGGIFQPLTAADGTLYWPGAGGGVSKSEDQGKSFSVIATSSDAPGLVAPASLAQLPDGRVVSVGKDHLLATVDKGASWKPIGEPLPYPGGGYDGAHGVSYSATTKTFFIWRWDCSDVVPDNAIMSMGFDWEAN